MLESSFFSSSWDPEIFPDCTFQGIPCDNEDYLFSWSSPDLLALSHCDFNSSCSDVESFNVGEFDNLPSKDSVFSQILEDSSITHIEDTPAEEYYNQSCNLNVKTLKRKHSCDLSSKTWSNMSIEDKERSLIFISEITCQMGIREQLEIIRIMDPDIEISADTKEFTLDISLLDDIRWKKIKDYFKRHKVTFPSHHSSSNKYNEHQNLSKHSKSRKSNSLSRTSRKQRQKKQKVVPETDQFEKLKNKQVLQGIKEEESGLFVYEKVVKFSSLEEDEEVNILE